MERQAEEIINAYRKMWQEWYDDYKQYKRRKGAKQHSKIRIETSEDTPIIKKEKKNDS
jgi:hypothetical protein